MKIRIEETGEVKDLIILDRKTGCEWTADLVESGNRKSDDAGIIILTADDYDWWSDYIADYEATEDEAEELAADLDDAGVECCAEANNLFFVLAKILEVTDKNFDTHRDAAVNAMREIRAEFLDS